MKTKAKHPARIYDPEGVARSSPRTGFKPLAGGRAKRPPPVPIRARIYDPEEAVSFSFVGIFSPTLDEDF